MKIDEDCGVVASVERWEVIKAARFSVGLAGRDRSPAEIADDFRHQSGERVSRAARPAADQFLIQPHTRVGRRSADCAAAGDEPRTMIAGYHWFTDWGRDR